MPSPNFSKLNIGSSSITGEFKREGWLSIDICKSFKVLPMSGTELGFRDNTFEVIKAIHVLEHINRNYSQQLVDECYRTLQPKGTCYVEVPDFQEVALRYITKLKEGGDKAAHCWLTSIYGKQRYQGDAHNWGFTQTSLLALFQTAGFSNVQCFKSTTHPKKMISSHHKQEPVILAVGRK